jgi:integrase
MFKRIRYQQGCLTREKRNSGPDVWIFRWREVNASGKRVNRKIVLGTVEQFSTQAAAERAVAALRIEINKESAGGVLKPITFGELVAHYLEKELPEDSSLAKVPKAHSTAVTYRRYLRKWILPRWQSYQLDQIHSVPVEDWLHGLSHMKNGTKAKMRNIMSAVFRHAIRYGFLPRTENSNPIQYVRQSAESEVIHTILTKEQVWGILSHLREPVHTMAFLDAFTGLRVSELLALKWSDIDFETREVHVRRAIVYGVVGKCKSKASKKPVPLDPVLAEALQRWRRASAYNRPDDWVFASPKLRGRKPLTPGMLIRSHLRPAAKKAGISGKIGWHTFRRTIASLFIANGEDIKVVQESLRHANSKVTLDLYAQATTTAKRNAQSKLIRMVMLETPAPDAGKGRSVPLRSFVSGCDRLEVVENVVARDGIEPPTPAFSGLRSTS